MKVLVLGAGFGGLEITTILSERLGDAVEVVLIDKSEGFVFGFSKLDVMFGRTDAEAVVHPYGDLVKPGVRFVQATVESIDPEARRVETDAGPFDADVVVVALGADLDPAATPGLVEGGHEFYTVPGAFAMRQVLEEFEGGHVMVGVTSTPFKCPPAPSETALMLHDFLTRRGLREASDISLVMPLGSPIPPSPEASAALLEAFAERGIGWFPDSLVTSLDPDRKLALLADGRELSFDLFLGVPVHEVPEVVAASGMCRDGWIPVDPRTLETAFPGVYAVGDVTSVGTPKAGIFAEGQGAVVAAAIIAAHAGSAPSTAPASAADPAVGGEPAPVAGTAPAAEYDGRGQCYLEFGNDEVAKVDVVFAPGKGPVGTFDAPSVELTAEKSEFGTSRARRWFGRDWSAT